MKKKQKEHPCKKNLSLFACERTKLNFGLNSPMKVTMRLLELFTFPKECQALELYTCFPVFTLPLPMSICCIQKLSILQKVVALNRQISLRCSTSTIYPQQIRTVCVLCRINYQTDSVRVICNQRQLKS